MKKIEKKQSKKFNFNLYLPVFILVIAATILICGTFAWFVDNRHADGTITFASIALSPGSGFETTSTVENAIPNSEILAGSVRFAKAADSSSIIVRARVYFEKISEELSGKIPDEWVAALNSATHETVTDTAAGYKWTSLQPDGYFYLVKNDGTGTNVKVIENDHSGVNDTGYYVFLNSLKFPVNYTDGDGNIKPITQLPAYAQYKQKLAIKVRIQAVQAEYTGVVNVDQAIDLFAEAFPFEPPFNPGGVPAKALNEISVSIASPYYPSSEVTKRLSSTYNVYLSAGQTLTIKDGTNYRFFLYPQTGATPTQVGDDVRLQIMDTWSTTSYTPTTSRWVGITMSKSDNSVFSAATVASQTLADYFTITSGAPATPIAYYGSNLTPVTNLSSMSYASGVSVSGGATVTNNSGFTTTAGRAASTTTVLKVNGGETISFVSNLATVFGSTNLTYALLEFKDAPLSSTNLSYTGVNSGTANTQQKEACGFAWISGSHTLSANTKYVVIAFKNGGGTADFNATQLAALNKCLQIN